MQISITVSTDHMSSPEEIAKMNEVLAILGGVAAVDPAPIHDIPEKKKKKNPPKKETAPATTAENSATTAAVEAKPATEKPKPTTEKPAGKITEEHVMKALTKYVGEAGMPAARELMSQFGVKKVNELKESDYAAVLQAIAEA